MNRMGYTFQLLMNQFATRFPDSRLPSRQAVLNIAKKFRNEHTLHNLNRARSGRKRSKRIPLIIDRVRIQLEHERDLPPGHPRSSGRRNELDLSQSSFRRIVRLDLKLMAYRLGRSCFLSARAKVMRMSMCRILISKPARYFQRLLVTDEAQFCLQGHLLNRGTNYCYSRMREGKPKGFYTTSVQCPTKLMVFAVMSGLDGKLWPFFYPRGTKLNTKTYIQKLQDDVFPALRNHYGDRMFKRLIFQQDGAPCHRSKTTITMLDRTFKHRVLALGAKRGHDWSPSSPDLSPLDYYLWSEVKRMVYQHPMPSSLDELREKIETSFSQIDSDTVMKAMMSMPKKAAKCVDAQGDRFEE